uniref:Secreted protein n=1 Tax=Macrostomum lignano TaxID=282301 RepID=A0A1I8FT00_9PLAT
MLLGGTSARPAGTRSASCRAARESTKVSAVQQAGQPGTARCRFPDRLRRRSQRVSCWPGFHPRRLPLPPAALQPLCLTASSLPDFL